MELGTAFFLGLIGSLHCAGMCGPLALAIPVRGPTRHDFVLSRVVYNLGRVAMYCLFGLASGALGGALAMAGWQRWSSMVAGGAIVAGLLVSRRYGLALPVSTVVWRLKSKFARWLRDPTLASIFFLGALNGLLPCGLVYVACAGAVAAGGIGAGTRYLLAFGAGTVPIMLGIGLAGQLLRGAARARFQRLVPVCLLALAALLILRGLSLGIPYLSPDLAAAGPGSRACH